MFSLFILSFGFLLDSMLVVKHSFYCEFLSSMSLIHDKGSLGFKSDLLEVQDMCIMDILA